MDDLALPNTKPFGIKVNRGGLKGKYRNMLLNMLYFAQRLFYFRKARASKVSGFHSPLDMPEIYKK